MANLGTFNRLNKRRVEGIRNEVGGEKEDPLKHNILSKEKFRQ